MTNYLECEVSVCSEVVNLITITGSVSLEAMIRPSLLLLLLRDKADQTLKTKESNITIYSQSIEIIIKQWTWFDFMKFIPTKSMHSLCIGMLYLIIILHSVNLSIIDYCKRSDMF